MKNKLYVCLLVCIYLLSAQSIQAQTPESKPQSSPTVIPGNGLSHLDFFYAGEAKTQNMYIVRSGKIIWALREWAEPTNLGPSTIFIPLAEPRTTENACFGEFH